MAYTNEDNIEFFLKRQLSADEQNLLDILLATIDAWIDDQTGSTFASTVGTKYYDGGERIIEIDPCTTITAIAYVDTDNSVIETYDPDTDYKLRPINEDTKKWIEFLFCAPEGIANIAVTASFGLGEVPDDIVYLATFMAGQMFSSTFTRQLKSESIEGYSRTFAEISENNAFISQTINKYTKDQVLL